jgi:MFS family permease
LANSFESFFLARLLTGVGEAGAVPAAFSLIAARFPQSKLAGATAIVQSGRYLGIVAGLTGAGWVLSHLGWRHTFLIFGLPGIALATILMFAVREPEDLREGSAPSILTVLRAISRRMIIHLFALVTTASLVGAGMLAWAPTLYQRSFHMTADEVGLWLGVAIGLGNVAGTLLGGYLTNRLAKGNLEGGLRIAFWGLAINLPLGVIAFCVDNEALSIALMLASSVSGALCVGPVYATLQALTQPKFRATSVALFQSGVMLFAWGLGPLLVGAISDAARTLAGEESLRWSLIIVTSCGIWPLYHGWRVMKLCAAEFRALAGGTGAVAGAV